MNMTSVAEAKVYTVSLRAGIRKTPEFAKKGLATHSVNVGLLYGHGCRYCSTPAMVRAHNAFREMRLSAFTEGMAVVDPYAPERVRREVGRLREGDVVQMCTITDAWAPEALELDLGRQCLEILLRESPCLVRVLTKNAAVEEDFDLMEEFRDRVLLGLSLTAPPSRAASVQVVEPFASPVPERVRVMEEAVRRRLRVYGMVCPCLPGVLDDEGGLCEVADLLRRLGAEEVFLEPVNPRGRGLVRTEEAFRAANMPLLANAAGSIRRRAAWSSYARALIETAEAVFANYAARHRLRILLYPSGLRDEDRESLKKCSSVVWL